LIHSLKDTGKGPQLGDSGKESVEVLQHAGS